MTEPSGTVQEAPAPDSKGAHVLMSPSTVKFALVYELLPWAVNRESPIMLPEIIKNHTV